MENFIVSLNCVTPMFVTLCIGLLVRWSGIVPPEMFRQLSMISFRALLPCQMFYNLYSADLGTALQPSLLIFLAVWLLIWYALSYGVFARSVKDLRRRGAYIQVSFRSNIAVVGVSLAQSMTGAEGIAMMAMVTGMLVPMFNILAVFTLESCQNTTMSLRKTLWGVVRNPLIIGCVLGLISVALQIRLPESLERAVSSLGSAGGVNTLLALGASFQFSGLGQNKRAITLGCVLRLVLAPLTAVTAAVLLGFRDSMLGTVLICTAAPMASAAYPMAMAAGSDYELTGQLVVMSSLMCSFTLFLWIFVLKQLGLM